MSNPHVSAILILNGTNHKQWIESLMMNLTIMKMDLALRTEASLKPFDESNKKDKKAYEDWEYLNMCLIRM